MIKVMWDHGVFSLLHRADNPPDVTEAKTTNRQGSVLKFYSHFNE